MHNRVKSGILIVTTMRVLASSRLRVIKSARSRSNGHFRVRLRPGVDRSSTLSLDMTNKHFAYEDTNGGIWDAFYCPLCSGDNKWKLQQINCGKNSNCVNKNSDATTDGPPAVSAPFINTYADADQQHFSYLAANGATSGSCRGSTWAGRRMVHPLAAAHLLTFILGITNSILRHRRKHLGCVLLPPMQRRQQMEIAADQLIWCRRTTTTWRIQGFAHRRKRHGLHRQYQRIFLRPRRRDRHAQMAIP
jgi:hypothetical protein